MKPGTLSLSAADTTRVVFDAARRSGVALPQRTGGGMMGSGAAGVASLNVGSSHSLSLPGSAPASRKGSAVPTAGGLHQQSQQAYARNLLRLHVGGNSVGKRQLVSGRGPSSNSTAAARRRGDDGGAVSRAIADAVRSNVALDLPTAPPTERRPSPGRLTQILTKPTTAPVGTSTAASVPVSTAGGVGDDVAAGSRKAFSADVATEASAVVVDETEEARTTTTGGMPEKHPHRAFTRITRAAVGDDESSESMARGGVGKSGMPGAAELIATSTTNVSSTTDAGWGTDPQPLDFGTHAAATTSPALPSAAVVGTTERRPTDGATPAQVAVFATRPVSIASEPTSSSALPAPPQGGDVWASLRASELTAEKEQAEQAARAAELQQRRDAALAEQEDWVRGRPQPFRGEVPGELSRSESFVGRHRLYSALSHGGGEWIAAARHYATVVAATSTGNDAEDTMTAASSSSQRAGRLWRVLADRRAALATVLRSDIPPSVAPVLKEALDELARQFEAAPAGTVAATMAAAAVGGGTSSTVLANAAKLTAADRGTPSDPLLEHRLHIEQLLNGTTAAGRMVAELPATVAARLPPKLFKSTVRWLGRDRWAEACELVAGSETQRHDPYGFAMCELIRSLPSGTREDRDRLFETTHAVEQKLRVKLSDVGRYHAVVLMRGYGRSRRFHEVKRIHAEVTQRGEVDEAVHAALLRFSTTAVIKAMLSEMKAKGMVADSPVCIAAAMMAMLGRGEMDQARAVYDGYRGRTEAFSGGTLQAPVLWAAVRMLSLHSAGPAPEALLSDITSTILGQTRSGNIATSTLRTLLPALSAAGRHEDVLAVVDHVNAPSQLERMGREAVVATNVSLAALGRDAIPVPAAPTSASSSEESSSSDDRWGGATSSSSSSSSPAANAGNDGVPGADLVLLDGLLPPAERMLGLAKDRNWEEALQLVAEVPLSEKHIQDYLKRGVSASPTTKQLTLVFNCALSAAVDEADVAESVFGHMRQYHVPANPTTYNTVMSAFARAGDGRWERAIETFQTMPERDASSFAVALGILGRHARWADAAAVFAESRLQKVKLAPTQYGSVIQATHQHSWSAALAAFTDLRKVHGPTAIKELMVNRVVASLQTAGRSAEASKVLAMTKADTKKKSGKKAAG